MFSKPIAREVTVLLALKAAALAALFLLFFGPAPNMDGASEDNRARFADEASPRDRIRP